MKRDLYIWKNYYSQILLVMKKILLFSVLLLIAGLSSKAQERNTPLKNKNFAPLTLPSAKTTATETERRNSEKQKDFKSQKTAGTDTKFSKAPVGTTTAAKKD